MSFGHSGVASAVKVRDMTNDLGLSAYLEPLDVSRMRSVFCRSFDVLALSLTCRMSSREPWAEDAYNLVPP